MLSLLKWVVLKFVQADVQVLKSTLWGELQSASRSEAQQQQQPVAFQQLIGRLPQQTAGSAQDLSVHLCFICCLHLANEQGLSIQGSEDLEQLDFWRRPQQGP